MIASLVRPMAWMKSGWGGESGAQASPSIMRESGNFSSWALCRRDFENPRNNLDAAARLCVGAKINVRFSGFTPQASATFWTTSGGGGRSPLENQSGSRGVS